MFFHIIGVKEELDTTHQVNVLVESISQLLVRKIFEEKQIVIVSLSQYDKSPESFGDISFEITYNNQPIKFFVAGEDPKEVCLLYMKLGFVITSITKFSSPLPLSESQDIIDTVKQELSVLDKQQQEFLEQKEVAEKKMFEDKKLLDLKNLLQETLAVIDEIESRTVAYVDSDKLKRLRDLRGELSKIRLGTNKAKMKDFLGQIYALLEKVNEEYFAHPEVQQMQQKVLEESLVTDNEVFHEEAKFSKSQLVKKLGLSQSNNDKYYLFLGKIGIFVKFLKKDFLHTLVGWKQIVFASYDFIEYFLATVVVSTTLIFVFQQKILGVSQHLSIYYFLTGWGLFGLLFYVFKQYVQKKHHQNVLFLLGALPILFLIYMFFWNILRHSFAL